MYMEHMLILLAHIHHSGKNSNPSHLAENLVLYLSSRPHTVTICPNIIRLSTCPFFSLSSFTCICQPNCLSVYL